jgi:hypothetical protein
MSALTAPALPLTTVTAMNLVRGDLIGGTSGEWVTVSSVWVDPNARHLVADVEVSPVDHPERLRTWPIDAHAQIAILRTAGGVL